LPIAIDFIKEVLSCRKVSSDSASSKENDSMGCGLIAAPKGRLNLSALVDEPTRFIRRLKVFQDITSD
jgi:hypothetical protein